MYDAFYKLRSGCHSLGGDCLKSVIERTARNGKASSPMGCSRLEERMAMTLGEVSSRMASLSRCSAGSDSGVPAQIWAEQAFTRFRDPTFLSAFGSGPGEHRGSSDKDASENGLGTEGLTRAHCLRPKRTRVRSVRFGRWRWARKTVHSV